MERARQASATSSASVATTTGSIRPLALAARHTHSTMGRPAMGRSTLRAMRVEPSRAGMTAAMRRELMQSSVNAAPGASAMLQERAAQFDRPTRPRIIGMWQLRAAFAPVGPLPAG